MYLENVYTFNFVLKVQLLPGTGLEGQGRLSPLDLHQHPQLIFFVRRNSFHDLKQKQKIDFKLSI